jgi:very-short-patch-repair endonuclease
MIWVLLIVLFHVAGWLIGKLAKPTLPEPWTIQPEPGLAELRADDPTWKERVLEYCESPAESAFLKAMTAGCDLRPDLALLKGGGLSLTLQVKMPPYRADFLANDWLVIEIDGAAYHSSPEAIASDQKRDEYLRTKGYSTIRIPAKVVFNDAREAVRRVRAAIAEGPPAAVRRVREAMAVTAITKPSGWIASRAERVTSEPNSQPKPSSNQPRKMSAQELEDLMEKEPGKTEIKIVLVRGKPVLEAKSKK